MSATPTIRLDVPAPSRQQDFWEIMRLRKEFTVTEIFQRTRGTTRDCVRQYVACLLAGGFIARLDNGKPGQGPTYRLMKDQPDAPRVRRDGSLARDKGSARDHMWRTMKMLGVFTARDLAIHASTEAVKISPVMARAYIRRLVTAGYLVLFSEEETGAAPRLVYRLLPSMNTGPLAPMVQRTQWVWDSNLKRVMGEPEEVADVG